jgi:predicted DCC family thiol-disulfide oxidoreductase YuxK
VTNPLLFYDGDCNFCDRTVSFVLRHERGPEFRFVPLQSPAARELLGPLGVRATDLSSMLVLADGRLHRESAALIEVLRRLKAPWNWLRITAFVPQSVRGVAYRYVGARRYRWWGRRADRCATASKFAAARFLTDASSAGGDHAHAC